jgi:hypothetical protein
MAGIPSARSHRCRQLGMVLAALLTGTVCVQAQAQAQTQPQAQTQAMVSERLLGLSEEALTAALPGLTKNAKPPRGPHGVRGLLSLANADMAGLGFEVTFIFAASCWSASSSAGARPTAVAMRCMKNWLPAWMRGMAPGSALTVATQPAPMTARTCLLLGWRMGSRSWPTASSPPTCATCWWPRSRMRSATPAICECVNAFT